MIKASSEYSDEFVSDQSESETLQEGESFGSATTNIYAQHHSNETETPSANQKGTSHIMHIILF